VPNRQLRQVAFDDDLVAPLLAGLADEYAARYGEIDELSYTTASEFEPPAGAFFVMIHDGITVAGGGYRRMSDDVCEVKRLWTSPTHRRRGLAGAILDVVEAAAAGAGYRDVWLETGPAQPEAVSFYEGRGYRPIPLYGRYDRALAFARPLQPREVEA
jgi:GNAT superfamily N-acetyltransferase